MAYEFPTYTRAERLADAIIHAVGIAGLGMGSLWLMALRAGHLPDAEFLSLAAYTVALSGTLVTSTVYHLARPGRRKEILRRVDHAMIYALIAGTYTPFAVRHLERGGGDGGDLLAVWTAAIVGMGVKLAFPRRFERFGLALYLGLGWAMAVLAPSMWASLSTLAVILLVVGGVLYTVGSAVHLMVTLTYHNALWHALVVTAAGCHLAAVALVAVP